MPFYNFGNHDTSENISFKKSTQRPLTNLHTRRFKSSIQKRKNLRVVLAEMRKSQRKNYSILNIVGDCTSTGLPIYQKTAELFGKTKKIEKNKIKSPLVIKLQQQLPDTSRKSPMSMRRTGDSSTKSSFRAGAKKSSKARPSSFINVIGYGNKP